MDDVNTVRTKWRNMLKANLKVLETIMQDMQKELLEAGADRLYVQDAVKAVKEAHRYTKDSVIYLYYIHQSKPNTEDEEDCSCQGC